MTNDFVFRVPPLQNPITEDRIREMLGWRPRRMQLGTQWQEALHPPSARYSNWTLVLPFCETFRNAFHLMRPANSSGLMSVKDCRCMAFLNDANDNPETLDRVRRWVASVGRFVAVRDCLAMSFAIDYEREGGDPNRPQAHVGALRSRAKTYGAEPTPDSLSAAGDLARACIDFLATVTCYELADCVVGMPPSDPEKNYNLAAHLADQVAASWGREDLSGAVTTIRRRIGIKDLPLGEKLETLRGTLQVDAKAVRDRVILLIDDLYQSGVSMNYVAMELLAAGATTVFGLACEKTCRNDDNLSGSR